MGLLYHQQDVIFAVHEIVGEIFHHSMVTTPLEMEIEPVEQYNFWREVSNWSIFTVLLEFLQIWVVGDVAQNAYLCNMLGDSESSYQTFIICHRIPMTKWDFMEERSSPPMLTT
jgi:hypothetical protein